MVCPRRLPQRAEDRCGGSPGGGESGRSLRRLRVRVRSQRVGSVPALGPGPGVYRSPSRLTDESGDEESVSQTDKTELQTPYKCPLMEDRTELLLGLPSPGHFNRK